MKSKHVYFIMIGLIVLLLAGLVGGSYGVDSMLQQQSKKLVSLKAKNQTLSQQQTGLAKAKEDVQQYTSLEQIAKSIVPQDKDQAEAVREIVNIAKTSGVSLSSINFPSSTLGAGTATKSSITQVKPVTGIKDVYELEITLQSDATNPVSYSQFIDFLSKLENNRRTAQVSSISLQPLPSNRNLLTFTLILDEYIKP